MTIGAEPAVMAGAQAATIRTINTARKVKENLVFMGISLSEWK
jgi:hypothetical protein